MAADFLPDYNFMPWNGRYRPMFKLFAGENWRLVRANRAPVECDTPGQAISAAKDHVKRILNPAIRSTKDAPNIPENIPDVLDVDAWRHARAGQPERDQRAAFGSIFKRGREIKVETKRAKSCSQ